MADTKITGLTAVSAAAATNTLPAVEDPSGTPVTKKVTLTQIAALFQTIWTSLQFGGATSSFPMLKRSTTTLQTKLADDSAFTNHEALGYMFGGLTTNTLRLASYQATVTVLNGATDGKEAAIAMPDNFLPLCVGIHVTVAATNAVNLTDIGDEGDTDSYVDTIAVAVNSTGYKGMFACNGLRGFPGGTANTGALGTADEVMATVSGDPGATGVTMRFTFLGIVGG